MSKINIHSLQSNNTVVGDNNEIVMSTSHYSQDALLRDEADRFNQHNIEANYYIASGHKNFINELRLELFNYYTVESKSIFLDQVKKGLIKYIKDFEEEAPDNDLSVLRKMLMFIDQEINELPKIVQTNSITMKGGRTKVFISYSQKDRSFLDDLKRHFKSLEDIVDFWDDSRIEPGQKWKEEIELAMNGAEIAILLISADFYCSDFIKTNELPRLLKKANEEGATILCVILKPCMFDDFKEINVYQAINDPKKSILALNEVQREEMWVSLVTQVKNIVNNKVNSK